MQDALRGATFREVDEDDVPAKESDDLINDFAKESFEQNFTFSPPMIASTLKYDGGRKIIELCVWLPSGKATDAMEVSVAADNKHLNLCIPMDENMGNGLLVHGELVPEGSKTFQQKKEHVRVNHWDTLIKENATNAGQLPSFNASLELPEFVHQNTILREVVKKTPSGSALLVVDLLVEEPKKPSASKKRKTIVVNVEDTYAEDST